MNQRRKFTNGMASLKLASRLCSLKRVLRSSFHFKGIAEGNEFVQAQCLGKAVS